MPYHLVDLRSSEMCLEIFLSNNFTLFFQIILGCLLCPPAILFLRFKEEFSGNQKKEIEDCDLKIYRIKQQINRVRGKLQGSKR